MAALSAASSAVAASVEAQMRSAQVVSFLGTSGPVESRVVERPSDPQANVFKRDLVDSLQNAKLEPLPNNAADFRVWNNTPILMLGRLDISGIDYLTTWIAVQILQVVCLGWTGGLPQSS